MPNRLTATTLLRMIGKLLPGDYLKTSIYLGLIKKPRKLLRTAINGFYRMEHVYDVLGEVKRDYQGKFSVLEFGADSGYSFAKTLYAVKHSGMSGRVVVHAFDSFEGMPASDDRRDRNIVTNQEEWVAGSFDGRYTDLKACCEKRYTNFRIHKGYFENTLTEFLLDSLKTDLPILVWIDCDFFTSAQVIFERIIPVLPTGCVVYFDEYEFNYGSRFTGEARIVHEVNTGHFGPNIELVLDPQLSLDSRRVYRFVRFEGGPAYTPIQEAARISGRRINNGSPFP